MSPGSLAFALALWFAVAAPAHAIYKWVDEKGVTHFSEHPPPGKEKATKIEPKVTPPSVPAKPADWKAREQEARKLRLERDQKSEYEKGKAHNEAAERANKCNYARRQLAVLERQVPIFTTNEKGERVFLEDRERPAEVARWQGEARAHCER
ncbi:MAG TPA: DUF4124 domain-containing protein [Usitatibacter sp.]|nr:DUF4124 domain-containing protein [Usitatibacter sp.]